MKNINWILHCSATDLNFKNAIPRLTDEELLHCLITDKRKTALRQLEREAKKRGINKEGKVN